jgi:hypothetical protein
MNESKLDISQLQRRDPAAWTALLCSQLEGADVVVTAVSTESSRTAVLGGPSHQVVRYVLALANHADPITFIGKRTSRQEALFYRDIGPHFPSLTPRCWFTHIVDDKGWIVLDDVPDHFPPHRWTHHDVEAIIHQLAGLHATFWNRAEELQQYQWLPHFIGRHQRHYTWETLRQGQAVYFDEGPPAVLSEHAIHNAGRLAPTLLQAANGLTVLRNLGGWPGILGESHLAAAADLLDDPVPMLEPLLNLPATLLHGNPHNYHWRLNLFDEVRLLDWQKATIGPGVCELISFIEQIDLIYAHNNSLQICVRQAPPTTEETLVDSYMLAMSGQLGRRFNARAVRQAIPAARCLHILCTWFPYFATWFDEMPNQYTWQKINGMSDEQLMGTLFQPMVSFRPYLTAVFKRFLHAYKTL